MSSPLPVQEVGVTHGTSLSMDPKHLAAGANGVTMSATLHGVNGNVEQSSSRMSVGQRHLNVPSQASFRPSIDTLSEISAYTADHESGRRTGRLFLTTDGPQLSSMSPPPSRLHKGAWAMFWARNKGSALVLLSQFFGGLMSVTTRLLETSGSGMHPFQVCAPTTIDCKRQLLTDLVRFCSHE